MKVMLALEYKVRGGEVGYTWTVYRNGKVTDSSAQFPTAEDAGKALDSSEYTWLRSAAFDSFNGSVSPHSEIAIYKAQQREDARADAEGRVPRLIATMADIADAR